MDLTNEQWEKLAPFFEVKQPGTRGRPPRDPREVLSGILWILRTGAQWHELIDKYPPYQTCHRWFQKWVEVGLMEKILTELARDLYERGEIDITECFIDGMFVPSKKGAQVLGRLSGARVARSWRSQTMIVFLSPYAQTVLKHMKSSSWKKPSTTASQKKRQSKS